MNQEKVCSLSQESIINSTLTSVAVGISCVGPLGEKQGVSLIHRLNMELISKVYLGSFVQLYLLAETPQYTPPPAFGFINEGAIVQKT